MTDQQQRAAEEREDAITALLPMVRDITDAFTESEWEAATIVHAALEHAAAEARAEVVTDGPWRIGQHYGIHVYEGDRPVATFHRAEDAVRAVAAVKAAAEARADLATTIEALVKGYDVGTLDAEMVVDRLRTILADAAPTRPDVKMAE